jgi:hypothetical protein
MARLFPAVVVLVAACAGSAACTSPDVGGLAICGELARDADADDALPSGSVSNTPVNAGSLALTDERGLVVAAHWGEDPASPRVAVGPAALNDGTTGVPFFGDCGRVDEVALRFATDEPVGLQNGETTTGTFEGERVVVKNVGTTRFESANRCTDVSSGIRASWWVMRASAIPEPLE